MKILYHLPNHLVYDANKLKFVAVDFKLALHYLKLIYKDSDTFQSDFLSKLDKIKSLKSLSASLKRNFNTLHKIKVDELMQINNKAIKNEAKLYFQKRKKSGFFDKYISKIKLFLDEEELKIEKQTCPINDSFNSPYLNTNGPVFKIMQFKEYTITILEDKVNFEMDCVEKLIIESPVKFLSCKKSKLKKIILNDELLYLDASENSIENILLNKNLVHLEVPGNRLKALKCNANLKELFVTNNQLENVTLNERLSVLICNGNKLKVLNLNQELEELYCIGNQLNYLELNDNLTKLQAQDNPLKLIILNKNIKEIEVSHPKNEEIMFDNSVRNNQVTINYYIN